MFNFIVLILCCLPIPTLAAKSEGLGDVAVNLMSPVGLFSNFINSGCIIIGGAFLFASIIKYIEHKRSPLMVPISVVVFLFIAGLLLVCLPLLSYAMPNGGPLA
jgi:hypothetical protein